MNKEQKKLLNESLELLIKLDKKSMCLFSEDIKEIAFRIHTAYNLPAESGITENCNKK